NTPFPPVRPARVHSMTTYTESGERISVVLALVLAAVFGAMTSARAAESSAAGTADTQTAHNGSNVEETLLAEIVVTATRVPQSSFDLPVSVDSVGERRIHEGQLPVNMSDALGEVHV